MFYVLILHFRAPCFSGFTFESIGAVRSQYAISVRLGACVGDNSFDTVRARPSGGQSHARRDLQRRQAREWRASGRIWGRW